MCIAVLIADDHGLVRSGVRGVLERKGFLIAAEASTPAEVMACVLKPSVQVVLLDLSWSNCANATHDEGLKLLKLIRAARASPRVLMYSIEASPQCIERCRHAGASGYLIKGLDDRLLAWAVRTVYAGGEIWPDLTHARLRRAMPLARPVR